MSLESTEIEFNNESDNETEKLSFRKACVEGNLKVVKVYLAQLGFDMNVRDNYGNTGFQWACWYGNLNVVQFLLQKGFDMNVGNNNGDTGFHWACENGDLNVVQFLVQQGCDMNVRDDGGYTGFHLACDYGNFNVVQFLLQQGFEGINEPDFNGQTGLQYLIEKRDDLLSDNELFMPCILLLIESGAQMNENEVFEDLISAIENRIFEITFMKETIFEKWTGRIAQAITDYTIDPSTSTSLQNLSQILD